MDKLLALVAPKTKDFSRTLPMFQFSSDLRLWAVAFDLERGAVVEDGGGGLRFMGAMLPRRCVPLLRSVNQTLVVWARRKFKRFKFKRHTIQSQFLQRLATE